MIDNAMVALTHIPPDFTAYNADLVGPADTPGNPHFTPVEYLRVALELVVSRAR